MTESGRHIRRFVRFAVVACFEQPASARKSILLTRYPHLPGEWSVQIPAKFGKRLDSWAEVVLVLTYIASDHCS